MENQKTVDDFVQELNKSLDLLKILNEAVKTYMQNQTIDSLEKFQNAKRNAIKDWWNKYSDKEKLSDKFKYFKLENENLKELDKVLLDFDTAAEIVKKFKVADKTQRLQGDNAEKAVDTFNSLLKNTTNEETKTLNALDFYNFIYQNIDVYELSSKQFDSMLEYVSQVEENKKFDGAKFWNLCDRLKFGLDDYNLDAQRGEKS